MISTLKKNDFECPVYELFESLWKSIRILLFYIWFLRKLPLFLKSTSEVTHFYLQKLECEVDTVWTKEVFNRAVTSSQPLTSLLQTSLVCTVKKDIEMVLKELEKSLLPHNMAVIQPSFFPSKWNLYLKLQFLV